MSDDERYSRSQGGPSRNRPGNRGPSRRTALPPSERARAADLPRQVAYEALRSVATEGAYVNLLLPSLLRQANLSGRDAAFATQLTYGTIRMRGQYDAVLNQVIERGIKHVDPQLLDILRLATHQIHAMRVPDHAAVSANVALARQMVGIGASKFVNGVLRAVLTRGYDDLLIGALPDDQDERIEILTSHPRWIVRAIRAALKNSDRAGANLEDVLEANNVEPHTTLAVRPGLAERAALLNEIDGSHAGRWTPTALVLDGGDPGRINAVRDGRVGVQDEGSQLVALALTQIPVEGKDGRWLDMCAGPGGKAAMIAAIAAERNAYLIANEVMAHRAELVKESIAACKQYVKVVEGDGRDIGAEREGYFDRILLDAPCTGLGALRRRPDARWRHGVKDMATLGPLQHELLDSAISALRPGGVVLYATCSPHIAETRLVIRDLLRSRQDAESVDLSQVPMLDATGAVGGDGALQLWTDLHGTDSMFMAAIRRR